MADDKFYVLVECDTISDLRIVRRAIHATDASERDYPFLPNRSHDAYGRPSRWAEVKALFDLIRVPS